MPDTISWKLVINGELRWFRFVSAPSDLQYLSGRVDDEGVWTRPRSTRLGLAVVAIVLVVAVASSLWLTAKQISEPWPLPTSNEAHLLEGCGCPLRGRATDLRVAITDARLVRVQPHYPAEHWLRTLKWSLIRDNEQHTINDRDKTSGIPPLSMLLGQDSMNLYVACTSDRLVVASFSTVSVFDLETTSLLYASQVSASMPSTALSDLFRVGKLRCYGLSVADGAVTLPNEAKGRRATKLRISDGEFVD